MLCKIGIIAGGGKLPKLIAENLIKKNYKVHFFCIKDFAIVNDYKKFEFTEIKINSLSFIIDSLKDNNIEKVIMAGKISRPSIKDIKFDLKTLGFIKSFFLESKGDDQLLRVVSNFFENNGFPLFDWRYTCHEMFSSYDNLTKDIPSKNAKKNMQKGIDLFKTLGKADIGQSLIIQNQLILGVECIEGTDELISRCNDYKRNEDRGILLKLSKYNQHDSLDVPTIGIQTMQQLKKYSYEGVYIEKNKCIILEKEEVIHYCNENNLFLSTVNKIE